MNKKPDLYIRFLNFMIAVHKKNDETWISRDILKDYAFNAGYRSQIIWDAFEKLDKVTNMGKIFNNGVKYRYYNMSKEDIEILERKIKWFNDYPDNK